LGEKEKEKDDYIRMPSKFYHQFYKGFLMAVFTVSLYLPKATDTTHPFAAPVTFSRISQLQ
jgi:hypothetical protein